MDSNSKIYVAGHRGLVGSAIVRKLRELGYNNIITATRKECNLIDPGAVASLFYYERPDYVFDAAAKVGGIHANDTYSADFIYENLMIQNNLIHYANEYKVKKFLFMGSVCIYPKYAETPVKEESLLTGYLEPTNEAYAVAKIAGIKMCQAYAKQYGMRSACIMPANLYGPNDNYSLENSHVIPAMINKFTSNSDVVTLWGDGSPYREFLYVDDMADACIFLMKNEQINKGEIVNVGSGEEISIRDLAGKIALLTDFKGNIVWDTSKPNGTPKRPLDYEKIRSLGWNAKYNLDAGLKKTLEWYKQNNL